MAEDVKYQRLQSSRDEHGRVELEAIKERRRAAFLDTEEAYHDDLRIDETIGLALSAGGIRSAAFNLGLLQAFAESGLIRFVDLLSTTGGGSWIGTYFSTLLCHPKIQQLDKNLSLLPDLNRGLSTTKPFTLGEQYISTSSGRFERTWIRLWANLLMLVSSLVVAASGIAFFWRMIDYPFVSDVIIDQFPRFGLYFSDSTRPFFASVFFFCVWICARIVRQIRRGVALPSRGTQLFFGCFIASLLIGLAVSLATNTPSTGNLEKLRTWIVGLLPWMVAIVVLVVVILNVAPQLGTVVASESSSWQTNRHFARVQGFMAGLAMILVPFYSVYFFAREGISNYQQQRPPDFVSSDFPHPFEFIQITQTRSRQREVEPNAPVSEHLLMDLIGTSIERHLLSFRFASNESETIEGSLRHALAGRTLFEVFTSDPRFTALLRKSSAREGQDFTIANVVELGAALQVDEERSQSGESEFLYSTRRRAREVVGSFLAAVLNDHVLVTPTDEPGPAQFAIQIGHDRLPSGFRHLSGRDEFDELWQRLTVVPGMLTDDELPRFNRLILEGFFSRELISERTDLRSFVLLARDQYTRLMWFNASLAISLFLAVGINWRGTSLNAAFCKTLDDAFVVRGSEGTNLRDLRATRKGGPLHVFSASMDLFEDWPWRPGGPFARYVFEFSPLACGSRALGRLCKTAWYAGGTITTAMAAATSGIDISVDSRTETRTLLGTLLASTGGLWLPNPTATHSAQNSSPTGVAIKVAVDYALTMLGMKTAEKWTNCFVADGALNDALGVFPLLSRKCGLILISDVSADRSFNFEDFERMRMRCEQRGRVAFSTVMQTSGEDSGSPWSFSALLPDESAKSAARNPFVALLEQPITRSNFIVGRATHQHDTASESIIVYIKPTLTGTEPEDLLRFARQNPGFPHESTDVAQFDAVRFDQYRQLGMHVGGQLCRTITNSLPQVEKNLWDPHLAPSDLLRGVARIPEESKGPTMTTATWDVFISHASEDKEDVARPLYEELRNRGIKVWFDEATLTLGDNLRRKIDAGLRGSRFGVVILSENFFSKEWPQRELDGLFATESRKKRILPVWHGIGRKDVEEYSPMLADRVAVLSGKGIQSIADEIERAIKAASRHATDTTDGASHGDHPTPW